MPYPTKARFQSVAGQELSPTHASLRSTTSIMIASSNSPGKGERAAQSIARCFTAHQRLFRACPRADRIFSTARNPIACATSSKDEPRVCVPSQPWRSFVLVAWPDGKTCYATRDRSDLTCAASTSKKRINPLPCLLICPSRRLSPLESSSGTRPR